MSLNVKCYIFVLFSFILLFSINPYLTHSAENLVALAQYCEEFLVHGVDVEGKRCGIEESLVTMLGQCSPIPVTYGKCS
jgi:hypothetical protein